MTGPSVPSSTASEKDSGFSEFIVDSLSQQGQRGNGTAHVAHLLTLLRQLPRCLEDSEDDLSSLERLSAVLGRAGQLDCLSWFDSRAGGISERPQSHHCTSGMKLDDELAETALRAMTSRTTETCGVSRDGKSWIVIASPVLDDPANSGCLAGGFRIAGESPAWLASLMELTALILGHSLAERNRLIAEQELAAASAIIDLAARIEVAETQDQACQVLADELSRHVGCPMAAIGVLASDEGSCRLIASSCSASDAGADQRDTALEAALDEVVIHDSDTRWPPESESRRAGLLTHRRLVEQGFGDCVIGAPLRNRDGSVFGAWLLAGDTTLLKSPEVIRFLRACEFRLAETLELVKRAQRPAWRRSLDRLIELAGGSPIRSTSIAITAIAGLLAIPLPHNVKCQCELQPMTRRFVAAPFNGSLEKSFVEPGDVVEPDQLLARMDDQEINWELAGADAEHHRASKERDTHLAKQDFASAQLAKYDMERLQLRRRLLSHRSENLEIRSPIAGLVIAGDLERSEGVPLDTGDTLFEIAPIDRMVVEVAIPETDIAHVETGQEVTVSLDGFAGDSLTGTLLRIHPRSEMKDGEHVFVGEVEFDNQDGRLLPGMHGQAHVSSGLEPLGWIVFHKPYEAFLFWMGW